jgi:large subunit ribosomal protein L9
MEVILRDNVDNLGVMGDIVKVKPGYARNFLLPRGIAVVADQKNVKAMEHEKRIIAERARKAMEAAKGVAGKLEKVSLSIKAKAGEEEKLFGSVTAMDIAEALKEAGHEVDKRKIDIAEPIKRLGSYTVSIKVGPEVAASVNVEVVAEEE